MIAIRMMAWALTVARLESFTLVALHQACYGRPKRRLGPGLNFPGAEHPVDSLKSPALDARALLNSVPFCQGYAGSRYDRTSGVGNDAPCATEPVID